MYKEQEELVFMIKQIFYCEKSQVGYLGVIKRLQNKVIKLG
jgi:hypothetical protein